MPENVPPVTVHGIARMNWPPPYPIRIACGDDLSLWVLAELKAGGHAVFSYDLARQQWTQLPALPNGDAVVDIALPDLENAWALGGDGSAYRYTAGQGLARTSPEASPFSRPETCRLLEGPQTAPCWV